VHAVVVAGAGDNFCSGGDVHEIIGPLVRLKAPELLMFTRMTGDLVKAMRACPQPIVAAVDGVCAGAGAIIAMASDLRLGTARSKTAFLFNRVGLAGCDMGACAMLPRIVGQGRASELLYTGRSLGGEEGERWGFFNRLCAPEALLAEAQALATDWPQGPTFANGITKTMLHQEWAMTIEQAIEAEAQAQALCMLTAGLHARLRGLRGQAEAACSRGTEMSDTAYLDWPFFEERHRAFAAELDTWAREHVAARLHGPDVDAACRALVRAGRGGWLRHAVGGAVRRQPR
jgi:enoyl-CoA hydratase/carnithine racemase